MVSVRVAGEVLRGLMDVCLSAVVTGMVFFNDRDEREEGEG